MVLLCGGWMLRAVGPAMLPTPGEASSGWTLKIEFADVLNVPDRAKVRLLGRDVGSLAHVRLHDKSAEVTLRIEPETRIPRASMAELRQDTPLGDIYIALTPNPALPTGPYFADGDTVPQAQTRAPVQMEQLLTSLADFLGSGSLPQLGNTFDRINSSLPRDPALTKQIVGNLSTTINAWAQDTGSLDTALTSLVDLTGRLAAERDRLSEYLAPGAEARWKTVIETGDIVAVFAALAPMFTNAAFLVPTLRETNSLLAAVLRPLLYFDRPAGSTRPDNIVNLRNLLRDNVIPYLHDGAKVNVVRLGIGDQMPSGEQADQAIRTLRMLGVVR
ncbi:hypothetical protein AXK58_16555 [Tsukamurella tyrosinosolvens]|nr:hypothetical protein AXK58_16555 [Tsukamurella tyrosinosolvens]